MGFRLGIIGLPNVGKSTIFNAMTSVMAEASNYPFCTIEPNIGIVSLEDKRLYKLARLVKPARIVPATVEFVDIAGLVKGASTGEGLGNQFLGHIRSVDALAHIVRCFDDPDIVHVTGEVDPVRDVEVIETELILADMQSVEKRISKLRHMSRVGDKSVEEESDTCTRVLSILDSGRPARVLDKQMLNNPAVAGLNLLTAKPVLYVANVDENGISGESACLEDLSRKLYREELVLISGKIESELVELDERDRMPFLNGMGLAESGLDRLASAGYRLLGLVTFFTAGKKEVKAWTVSLGTRAQTAAGVIHSDFERGFIRAEIISFRDYLDYGSEVACKTKGVVRSEGRDYIVKDGDVVHFRFNV